VSVGRGPLRTVRQSYAARFLAASLLVVVAVAVTGGVVFTDVSDSLRANVDERLASTTTTEARRVAETLDNFRGRAVLVSRARQITDDDADTVEQFLETQERETLPAAVEAVHIVAVADKTLVATSADRLPRGTSFERYR
jgi:hypothetical protein